MALASDTDIELVAKYLPRSPENEKRVKALVDKQLPMASPYLAAPVASSTKGGEIVHLAPLAEGHDLTEGYRTFPENLELAYQLMCQFTLLEDAGLAHGDIAPSNIMISDKGDVCLIDFDNFFDIDPSTPPPQMAGQHMMMAPELCGTDGTSPNIESDRFAYGVILNLLLLRRHPAGDAQTPSEASYALSTGLWPERDNLWITGNVPIDALGEDLMGLFDAAFSLDPHKRPSANTWREAISDALHRLVIHDCGQACVLENGQSHCSWCQQDIAGDIPNRIRQIKINVPSVSTRYGVPLSDSQPVVLERNNLAPQAQTVSSKHLEITPMGHRLFLRSNPTLMLQNGKWHQLRETWLDLYDLQTAPVTLKLADLMIDIGV